MVAYYLDYKRGLEVNGDYLLVVLAGSLFSWFSFIALFWLLFSVIIDKVAYNVGRIKLKRKDK